MVYTRLQEDSIRRFFRELLVDDHALPGDFISSLRKDPEGFTEDMVEKLKETDNLQKDEWLQALRELTRDIITTGQMDVAKQAMYTPDELLAEMPDGLIEVVKAGQERAIEELFGDDPYLPKLNAAAEAACGVKIDMANPQSMNNLLKMGQRIEDVVPGDNADEAWLAVRGFNLDLSEYYCGVRMVRIEGLWYQDALPPAAPEGVPQPFNNADDYYAMMQDYIYTSIKETMLAAIQFMEQELAEED